MTGLSDHKLLVFTAPSGSGKTTVVQHLLRTFDHLAFSVSATTRPRREGEQHGKDYYFLSDQTFRNWIKDGAFVEWEEVYKDQLYGTLQFEVERIWAQGRVVVFDIDVRGAVNIKARYPEQTLLVFIKVPSIEALTDRLRARGTESEASLQKRLDKIREELKYEDRCDTMLINDDLDTTLQNAEEIVRLFTVVPQNLM